MTDTCVAGEVEWEGSPESCEDSFERACLDGRARSVPSGRSYDDLARCADTIDRLNCRELGIASSDQPLRWTMDLSRMPAEAREACMHAAH
jgi:hypothetical protein